MILGVVLGKRVDATSSINIIFRAPDIAPDPVSTAVTDEALTMFLPARLLGSWSAKLVSNPKIEEFNLSPEAMAAQVALNRKSLEDENKKKKKQVTEEVRLGSLSSVQQKAGDAKNKLVGESSVEEIIKLLEESSDGSAEDKAKRKKINKKIAEQIKANISAAGTLLLCRYLDFDVEPGRIYRYRIRLVLYNPNYKTPAEKAETRSVVEGKERTTPWSEVSSSVLVQRDSSVFVTNIQAPTKIYGAPTINLKVFQWSQETGTPMMTEKLKVGVGDLISGDSRAYVVDLRAMSYELEEAPFETNSTLVAVQSTPRIDSKFHSQLVFPKKKRKNFGFASEVLIQDKFGQLIVKNSHSNTREKQYAEGTIQRLDSAFLDIKDARSKAVVVTDGENPDDLLGSNGETPEYDDARADGRREGS